GGSSSSLIARPCIAARYPKRSDRTNARFSPQFTDFHLSGTVVPAAPPHPPRRFAGSAPSSARGPQGERVTDRTVRHTPQAVQFGRHKIRRRRCYAVLGSIITA